MLIADCIIAKPDESKKTMKEIELLKKYCSFYLGSFLHKKSDGVSDLWIVTENSACGTVPGLVDEVARSITDGRRLNEACIRFFLIFGLQYLHEFAGASDIFIFLQK